jgi:hypothetical protein
LFPERIENYRIINRLLELNSPVLLQAEDRRLNRPVERGSRFAEDQEFRSQGQRVIPVTRSGIMRNLMLRLERDSAVDTVPYAESQGSLPPVYLSDPVE